MKRHSTSTTTTDQSTSSPSKPRTKLPTQTPLSDSPTSLYITRRNAHSTLAKFTIPHFSSPNLNNPKTPLYSKYFQVSHFDCRLLVYPRGDSQSMPGHVSLYLQLLNPLSNSKWDCFASYRLAIDNYLDDKNAIAKESWHRFSSKRKSHGWCDFAALGTVLDANAGFSTDDCVTFSVDITLVNEEFSFDSENDKCVWRVENFGLFREMIRTQKIMSPVFNVGECGLRISVYQSTVNGVEYLSVCLESKDILTSTSTITSNSNGNGSNGSCWCLFRMAVLNQKRGVMSVHRDHYGRFAGDNKYGDSTSLGWADFMKMEDFLGELGFLEDGAAVFTTSFHVVKEFCSFPKIGGTLVGGRSVGGNLKKLDGYMGKFVWKIENFGRLKDLMKKRKISGLSIKSKRFQIGNRDCRLIVYPRGQSQPPCNLSVFLEVTEPQNSNTDWSCFVSHRLTVINQKMEEKSVSKESQNRYSKTAKDWGWREFVTLTSLFDQDSGFLIQDAVVFSAEVLILKETSLMQDCCELKETGMKSSFTWKVDNFLSFKEIMETRKIFSKFFPAGGCDLRIGIYESSDTICLYLESEQSVYSDPDKNFWVKYRMSIVNQKDTSKSVSKESSICTKTWNNSVLQFMKVSDLLEAGAGFLLRDSVVFVCEILDCCPWFEFSDLEVLASDDDQDALTTDPGEHEDSDESDLLSGNEEDMFVNLLSRVFGLTNNGDKASQQSPVALREKLFKGAGAIASFLTGLRGYLNDPAKLKRFLLPAKSPKSNLGKKTDKNDESKTNKNDESSPSLMNLLMGVKVLQQAIIDLLLDIMVECCQPAEESSPADSFDLMSKPSVGSGSISPDDSVVESLQEIPIGWRSVGIDESTNESAVQSSDMTHGNTVPRQPIFPREAYGSSFARPSRRSTSKGPEQSEEMLGLIVKSLRALDDTAPQGAAEPRRKPYSAQRVALVLDKAPMHLQPDLVVLVPKLVERAEHPVAACALLDRLQMPDAESTLRLPVFGALSQMECTSEVWEHVLIKSLELLADSNDELLAVTVDFIFKAALCCRNLPEAVRTVRVRLKSLGIEVSQCVLDYLIQTVNSYPEIAETFLRNINSDDNFGDEDKPSTSGFVVFGGIGSNYNKLHSVNEHAFCSSRFSDIYILLEMLSIPSLASEAAQTLEKAVARNNFVIQFVAMIFERRLSRCLAMDEGAKEYVKTQQDDFDSLLGLAEAMSLSTNSIVRGFSKDLYTMLFKWYTDESHRFKMVKRLVDHATRPDASRDMDLDLEVLVILLCQEQGIVKPVLSMMREVAELANLDRAALCHKLRASEEQAVRNREEREEEVASVLKEKSVLSQRLCESEATNSRLKSDLRAEMDRFACERKELLEQRQEAESQLDWVRAEKDDIIKKLVSEKKILQDRLHDVEMQNSQLRSRNRDDIQRALKEKNAFTERIKSSEAARKRLDDELKRHATENRKREEKVKLLEDEVRQLTQTVGKTEGEKREKEEHVTRCEAYINEMDSKWNECQQYVHHLETQIQEEMSRHAPLYGAGLEGLSMEELETISRIHEEGLMQIRAIQRRKGNLLLNSSNSLSLTHGVYPSMPVELSNGGGVLRSGHGQGGVEHWFNLQNGI